MRVLAGCMALVLATLSLPREAAASEPSCPYVSTLGVNPDAPQLGNAERMAFIRARMELGYRRSLAWSLGWGITYLTAVVAQGVAMPFVQPRTRLDFAFGISSAGLGVLTRAISRPYALRGARKVRKLEGHGCDALREAELELLRSAEWERKGRRWFLHLGAFLFSVGMGLGLGLGFNRPISGNRQTAIGATAGQTMIITQPLVMTQALEHYRRGELDPPRANLSVTPFVFPGTIGLGMVGEF